MISIIRPYLLRSSCRQTLLIFYEAEQLQTVNKDHARLEIRECWVVSKTEYLTYLRRYSDWKNLHSLVKVVSQRQVGGKTTMKTRYFICSLTPTAQRALAGLCTQVKKR